MARSVDKPSELEIEGKIYELRFDLTALKDFEDATGKSITQFIAPVFRVIQENAVFKALADGGVEASAELAKFGLKGILNLLESNVLQAGDAQALLWAAIGGPDQPLSLRDAGRLVHAGNYKQVFSGLLPALAKSMPQKRDGEGADSKNG